VLIVGSVKRLCGEMYEEEDEGKGLARDSHHVLSPFLEFP